MHREFIATFPAAVALACNSGDGLEPPGPGKPGIELPTVATGETDASTGGTEPSTTGHADVGDEDPTGATVDVRGPQACADSGFCWLFPLPAGVRLRGIFEAPERGLWVVGDRGIILNRFAGRWRAEPIVDTRDLRGIWGSATGELWAVGARGVILHDDGNGWRGLDSGVDFDLSAIWGSAREDVWVTGNAGVLHFDGVAWTRVEQFDDCLFADVHGTGARDVWISGGCPEEGPVTYRFDGRQWESVAQTGEFPIAIDGLWVGGADVIGMVRAPPELMDLGMDGTWQSRIAGFGTGVSLNAIDAIVSEELWLAGSVVARVTGEQLETWASELGDSNYQAVLARKPGEAWTVGANGRVAAHDEGGWRIEGGLPLGAGRSGSFFAVRGFGPDVLAAGGPSGLWISDGEQWRREPLLADDGQDAGTVIALAGDTNFGVAATTRDATTFLFRRDSAGVWTPWRHLEGFEAGSLETDAQGRLWVAARRGGVVHWTGREWIDYPMTFVNDFDRDDQGAIWAIGETLLRFDGQHFVPFHDPPGFAGTALAGTALRVFHERDIWAVVHGWLAHYDGQTWTAHEALTDGSAGGLAGTAGHDLWYYHRTCSQSTRNDFAHFDGREWTGVSHPSGCIADLWLDGIGGVYAAVAGIDEGGLIWRGPDSG